MYNLNYFLDLAKQTAISAGKVLSNRQTSLSKINSSNGKDVKIVGDTVAESLILANLKDNSSFPILSEESGSSGNVDEPYLWIVDPLDGSLNYSREIPLSCISIGLYHKKNPVLGVVYDFNRNELFSGIVGEGANLNNHKINISSVLSKKEAVLCTGFPVNSNFSSDGLNDFISQVQEYKKIRSLGTAALSIAYVACGRIDAYFEKNIMLWDVAAACAIVLAAGGTIEMEINNFSDPLNVAVKCRELI